MKRIWISICLLFFLTVGLAACGTNPVTTSVGTTTEGGSENPSVTTTAVTTSVGTTTEGNSENPSVTTAADTHLHMDPVVYPDELDFEDPDSIVTLFDLCRELDGIKTTVNTRAKQIRMRGKVNGKTFALTVGLSKAEGHTTPEQIVTCAKLFWHCYPMMYARFATTSTPTSVILNIENEGYEIAHASGNTVHIHDQWLEKNPQDFDCLTHEFAHVIQGGWDGNYVPSDGDDTYMIERFADYCRFLYAYEDGYYNDTVWTLQTSKTENSYAKGVRFWGWLDYTYSTNEIDIMNRIQQAVNKKTYRRADWEPNGKAWDAIFEGTEAYGKDLNVLWEEYTDSDICNLSSKPRRQGEASVLLRTIPFRKAVRDRYPESDDYWKK